MGCSEAQLAAAKRYREKNKEKILAYQREYRRRYPDKHKAASKKWREENKEKVRAMKRAGNGLPEPTRPMPKCCELCGGAPNGNGCLHLDHDHDSGEFRGWLCHTCNTSLGGLGDNVAGLKRALEYLEAKE